ncbi:hypothetical protein H257_04216 [Aphanomyces astaci]|uniref:COMM domain-containing protein n=1 Tax=Aphanomyces astaci TaxID=112090 RepID=W4GWV2_APHAT|nr:hypothetical protein H257_04216 [Aphanomyces astaci]ETV83499.1 hypothetical protein H257_04216 [Aphanomyces astaci]|eukprot:XP_009826929.1 hypothetical protein H257_04216 [Aphanomyces astaci]
MPSLLTHDEPAAASADTNLKWRVDVVLHTKEQTNVQEPKALVELSSQEAEGNTVRMQMSRAQVSEVLREFEKIQQLIDARQKAKAN